VHPLADWTAVYTSLARRQPVGTPGLRAQALARWRGLPRLVDGEIANLREGVRLGYVAPGVSVRRALAGLDELLGTTVVASPFYSPADALFPSVRPM